MTAHRSVLRECAANLPVQRLARAGDEIRLERPKLLRLFGQGLEAIVPIFHLQAHDAQGSPRRREVPHMIEARHDIGPREVKQLAVDRDTPLPRRVDGAFDRLDCAAQQMLRQFGRLGSGRFARRRSGLGRYRYRLGRNRCRFRRNRCRLDRDGCALGGDRSRIGGRRGCNRLAAAGALGR